MGYRMDQVFKLGWEEWVGLPQLGLPALKAKVDTGARTSALHAFDIELFGPATKPKVRFLINPIPARPDLAIACSATIHDRRDATSSNGDTEARYVILSMLEIGPLRQEIEITLTDRANMSYRMLLGRQAIGADWIITPSESFCQPQRSYEVYHTAAVKETAPKRALRIAVLSREQNYTTQKLQAEGEARGHVVEVINTTRCYMALNAMTPAVYCDGQELPKYDAVIPRIGPSITAYGAADDFRSKLHRGGTAVSVRITREERETAIRSARAFGVGIAGVDMLRGADGPKVLEVNSSPGFEGIEEVTGKNIAAHLYSAIEKHVRPAPIKRRPPR